MSTGVGRRRLLGTVVAVTGLAAVAGAVAADAPKVTIRARVSYDPGTASRQLYLVGTVASSEAGELVEIQAKACGAASRFFYRLIGGTRTLQGGVWQLQNQYGYVDLYLTSLNSFFRARWKGNYSEPVLVRTPIPVGATWRPRRRVVDILVSTYPSGQNLRGRFVELQHRVEGTDQWLRVRQARLARDPSRSDGFKARFAVPTRGLTLRAYVPASTGAPCFSPAASNSWRS